MLQRRPVPARQEAGVLGCIPGRGLTGYRAMVAGVSGPAGLRVALVASSSCAFVHGSSRTSYRAYGDGWNRPVTGRRRNRSGPELDAACSADRLR
jgi:hypothetical protein